MIEQTNIFLPLIMSIPLLGVLFALISKDNAEAKGNNILSLGMLVTLTNLLIIFFALRAVAGGEGDIQFVSNINWLSTPKIEFVFGADIFSLLLIAAVHCAVLLGLIGIRNNTYRQKTLIIFALFFLSMITNYLLSYDLFSFYIFFKIV